MGKGLKKLNKILILYSEKVVETFSEFKACIKKYIKNGYNEELEKEIERVYILESEADQIRREIIKLILEGSFLSSTRQEFLHLVEMMDKIANRSEKILASMLLPEIHEDINLNIINTILSITESQVKKLKKAISEIFTDFDSAFEKAHSLELEEEEIDILEKIFVRELMKKDWDLSKKMYYREFVASIADISDIVEDVGDEIEKIVIARRG